MTDAPLDLDRLEEIAKRAGPWPLSNMQYLTAVDPPTVLRLLASARRVEEMERALSFYANTPPLDRMPGYPTHEIWLAFFSCNATRGSQGMEEFHEWHGDFGNFVASYQAMLRAALSSQEKKP